MDKRRFSLIAAMSKNHVIGVQNKLPWHLPDDFKFFKEKTFNHACLMGRLTFESMGKPLPHRQNLVISRNPDLQIPGVDGIFPDLKSAVEATLKNFPADPEPFIIGGAQIYKEALRLDDDPVNGNFLKYIYLTVIDAEISGDALFPNLEEQKNHKWKILNRKYHPEDRRHAHSFEFLTYEKK